ncbi:STAS domain-containing protein [Phaeovulum vinaykumarii]|uniref:Chemotaxis protein CheX n=1 Tax=Phaeovulum vinaykumarii TaxID=407234 RepID=A0A1N7LJR0_9RHOB|nr:STAS domain-containing protein [Phaeovulum vinaykumarii]SIS74024.1 chemotaxis protein CheX [Phaeovulum vinaykumarii]SOC04855.1 chemotaxis protein CheX [Phaeovulum vinaykumarii]
MTAALALPNRLDLPAARPLADALRANSGEDMQVDASTVAHIGGLCLQLLLSAAASARAAGHQFIIAPRSKAFDDAVALFGVSAETFESEGNP